MSNENCPECGYYECCCGVADIFADMLRGFAEDEREQER